MKKILLALLVLSGAILLAGIAAVLFIDVNAHKHRIEGAVSEALGMEFRIRGRMGLRLLPPAGVTLSDVRLRNRGAVLATAGAVRVGVELLPLFRGRLAITSLILVDPTVRIEKGTDGRFNFETPPRAAKAVAPEEKGKAPGSSLVVANGAMKSGSLVYLDRTTGAKTEVTGIEAALKELSFTASPGVHATAGIRFSASLRAKELATAEGRVRDLEAKVSASGGVYDVRPITFNLFGGKGGGWARADLSRGEPAFRAVFTLAGFRAEESLEAVAGKRVLSGPLTLSLDLACRGSGADRMKRTLTGTASLRGNGLTVHGTDVDGALSTVAAAQRLNLAEVGAFLLAAPLGRTATKGYRFGGILGGAGRTKDTAVTTLVSDWTVRNGIAEARDVALATRKNRIAMKGRLDIVNERFAGITVAVLDPAGCARIRQRIDGPFRDPRLDKADALQSAVVGSVFDLLSPARKLIGAPACERFYSGSVPHPG